MATRKKPRLLPLLFLAITLGLWHPRPGAAEPIRSIDEGAIESFVQAMTDIANNHHDLDPAALSSYLDDHIDDNGRFQSLITYDIPGMPPQEKELVLGKDQFIESLTTAPDIMENYEADVMLDHIKISRGGREAVIETTSTGTGRLHMGHDGPSGESVPVIGTSHCTQKLHLTGKGVIALKAAHCQTKIRFDPFEGRPLEETPFF